MTVQERIQIVENEPCNHVVPPSPNDQSPIFSLCRECLIGLLTAAYNDGRCVGRAEGWADHLDAEEDA